MPISVSEIIVPFTADQLVEYNYLVDRYGLESAQVARFIQDLVTEHIQLLAAIEESKHARIH